MLSANSVAAITGGAMGLGFACAKLCGARRMKVAILDVCSAQVLAAAEEAVVAAGAVAVLTIHCDVTREEDMASARDQVFAKFGGCHFLFLNAGIGGGGSALKHGDRWHDVFDVNLFGVIHGLHAFVPAMIPQDCESVVAVTGSRAGITTPPGDVAYNASKAAVRVLVEDLEHRLRNTKGCQVSARLLLPGMMDTEFAYNTQKRLRGARAAEGTKMGKGSVPPSDVADLLLKSVAEGGPFYVIADDSDLNREQFKRAVQWSSEDIVKERPPLSRWLSPYREQYREVVEAVEKQPKTMQQRSKL